MQKMCLKRLKVVLLEIKNFFILIKKLIKKAICIYIYFGKVIFHIY